AMPTTTGSISRAASLVKTEEAPHTTNIANATATGRQPEPRCAVIDSLPQPAAIAYPTRAMTAMAGWQPPPRRRARRDMAALDGGGALVGTGADHDDGRQCSILSTPFFSIPNDCSCCWPWP